MSSSDPVTPPEPAAVRNGCASGVAELGRPQVRIDGPLKVCGEAVFPGDVALPGSAHAALALSPIARGRVTAIHRDAALACPGVLLILTHEEVGDAIRPVRHLMEGGWANSSLRPLQSPEILYAGQIVALVVAETPEQARAAAAAMEFSYAAEEPVTSLADPHCTTVPLSDVQAEHKNRRIGDIEAGLATAAVRVDERYSTPIQHHNPIELPSTICR